MPTYSFRCDLCDADFDKVLRVADYNVPQPCPTCAGETHRVLVPVAFVLQGDAWPGKAIRVKNQMATKNARLGSKMKDRGSGVNLAPNVNGERVDTWADAQKLATSQGKDGSSYDSKVRAERQGDTA